MDSTKCGGELKDVLKEFAISLVSEEDFSRDIGREINEERKRSVQKY